MDTVIKKKYGFSELLGIVFILIFSCVLIGALTEDISAFRQDWKGLLFLTVLAVFFLGIFLPRILPFSLIIKNSEIQYKILFNSINLNFNDINSVYLDSRVDQTSGENYIHADYFLVLKDTYNKTLRINLSHLSNKDISSLFKLLMERIDLMKDNTSFINIVNNPDVVAYQLAISSQKDFKPTFDVEAYHEMLNKKISPVFFYLTLLILTPFILIVTFLIVLYVYNAVTGQL